MTTGDTIVALSTPAGAAPLAVVRLSGPRAYLLVESVVTESVPRCAGVRPVRLRWDRFDLPARACGFVAPRSPTGEDVVELHLPGNPLLVRSVLRRLTDAGARPAEPGEFTARAYFNGRIDLAQAEGVAATVSAASAAELAAARRLLAGELTHRLRPVTDLVADMLALVEVGIDFTDEDVSFLSPEAIAARARQADAALERLIADSRRFEPLTHEPSVVLVGRPNAGKSTLLNALCGRERAVVSPIAGTTRDVIWAEAVLPRGLVRVVDAAGIDEENPDDSDRSVAAEIARAMRARAERAADSADVLVLVVDATSSAALPHLPRPHDLLVLSKADLLGPRAPGAPAPAEAVIVSAVSGLGMDALRSRLDALAFGRVSSGAPDALALNERHRTAIAEARGALARAADQVAGASVPAELVALELREALDALGSVTGQVAPDDVLGRVFAGFCIGK